MEVIRTQPGTGSIRSRLAACRRCWYLFGVVVVVFVLLGYLNMNKSDNKIAFTHSVERHPNIRANISALSTMKNPVSLEPIKVSEIQNIDSSGKTEGLRDNSDKNDIKSSTTSVESTPSTVEESTSESSDTSTITESKSDDKNESDPKSSNNESETKPEDNQVEANNSATIESPTESKSSESEETDSSKSEQNPNESQKENNEEKSSSDEEKNDGDNKSTERHLIENTKDKISLLEYSTGKKIVAFGDSLTYGMVERSLAFSMKHPYTVQLKALINNNSTLVDTHGYPGRRSSSLLTILPTVLRIRDRKSNSSKTANKPISLVVYLGGTNDLLQCRSSCNSNHTRDISRNIIATHKRIHEEGLIYSVAMTIPYTWFQSNQSTRLSVNNEIRKYALQCNHRVALLDLEFLTPNSSSDATMTNDKHSNVSMFWYKNGSLHPTTRGYDAIGTELYRVISEYKINVSDYNKTNC